MSVGPSAAGAARPLQPADPALVGKPQPGKGKSAQDDKLLQACRDFESLFLQQILQEARQGIAAMSSDQPSFDRQVYEGWQDEQFAKSMSSGSGIGLAETLYRQLSGGPIIPANSAVPAVTPPGEQAGKEPRPKGTGSSTDPAS